MSPLAVLDRDLHFVAVNDAYCAVGGRKREELLGLDVFEAFPENPDDADDSGPADLRSCLMRVLAGGSAEMMPLQRYDVQATADGPFLQRFWSITASPVRSEDDGSVDYVTVHAEEVTSFIDERLGREAAGQRPRTAGQTDAVDTVFSAALRHAAAVNDFAEALATSSTMAAVANAFIRAGIELVCASGGAFVSRVGDQVTVFDDRTMDDFAIGDVWRSFDVNAGDDPFSDAIIGGGPLLFADRAQLLAAYPALAETTERTAHRAWAVLPMFDGATALGALGLTFDAPDLFSPVMQLDLQTLARLTTQASSRALLLEEQGQTIDSITRILESDLDDIAHINTSTLYRPAINVSRSGGDHGHARL